MQNKDSVYDLDNQLERTVEWLKYAEAKNGVLLTLVSALLVAFFQQDVLAVESFLGRCVCISLIIEIFYLLLSFSPILSVSEPSKYKWLEFIRKHLVRMKRKIKWNVYIILRRHFSLTPRKRSSINLHYYGSISEIGVDLYRYLVKKHYVESYIDEKYFCEVTNQIKINSDIAMKKMKCFRRSVKMCFVTFVLLILTA